MTPRLLLPHPRLRRPSRTRWALNFRIVVDDTRTFRVGGNYSYSLGGRHTTGTEGGPRSDSPARLGAAPSDLGARDHHAAGDGPQPVDHDAGPDPTALPAAAQPNSLTDPGWPSAGGGGARSVESAPGHSPRPANGFLLQTAPRLNSLGGNPALSTVEGEARPHGDHVGVPPAPQSAGVPQPNIWDWCRILGGPPWGSERPEAAPIDATTARDLHAPSPQADSASLCREAASPAPQRDDVNVGDAGDASNFPAPKPGEGPFE